MTLDEAIAATGRSCGKCSMCCKVFRIAALDKPADKWCQHCRPGKGGCGIYDTRPAVCRNSASQWLVDDDMGDEWFPARAKIMFWRNKNAYTFHVDGSVPNRWREPPYYEQIKHIAALYLEHPEQQRQVYVRIRLTPPRTFIILPDEDKDISEWVEAGDTLEVKRRRDGSFEAIRLPQQSLTS